LLNHKESACALIGYVIGVAMRNITLDPISAQGHVTKLTMALGAHDKMSNDDISKFMQDVGLILERFESVLKKLHPDIIDDFAYLDKESIEQEQAEQTQAEQAQATQGQAQATQGQAQGQV